MECGLSTSNGFGVIPISWAEIHAWAQSTGQSSWWIAQTVKLLSDRYVREYHAANDPARLSPMQEQMDQQDKRDAVSAQFKRFVQARK